MEAERFPFAACVLLLAAQSASAQSITLVNDTNDAPDYNLADGQIDADAAQAGEQRTLRATIQQVCYWGGSWTIQLPAPSYVLGYHPPAGGAALYVLSYPLTPLASLSIEGVNPVPSRIDAAGFGAQPDRILYLDPNLAALPSTVALKHVVLANGQAGLLNGGAIRHAGGKLLLDDVVFDQCSATDGGAIDSLDEVTATNCGFGSCSATRYGGALRLELGGKGKFTDCWWFSNTAGQHGGAISASGIELDLVRPSFQSNQSPDGGALRAACTTSVFQGDFRHNSASNTGGALLVTATTIVQLTRFEQNQAAFGGAVDVTGTGLLQVTSSTFHMNAATAFGGGVSNNGSLEALACTWSLNSAPSGGGIDTLGSTDLLNCTLSNNHADDGGAMTFKGSFATSTLSACTVADNGASNSGAGIYLDDVFGAPQVQVIGLLIAQNFLTNGLPRNYSGNILAGVRLQPIGPNLDSDGTCFFGPGNISGNPLQPLQGQVGPLFDYGGPTETQLLPPCSLAIDHGACVTASGFPLWVDQRGVVRVSPCDIGAFEGTPYASTPYCTSGTTTNGCIATMTSTGTPSATGLGNFVVYVDSVEGQKTGLVFYGLSGRLAAPWGGGSTSFLCVKAPTIRTPTQGTGGTNGQCNGAMAVNLDARLTTLPIGQIVDAQGWFRDPPAPKTTNLTGGLEFVVCP